ncbi:MAG: bifunctional 3-(3-hydroxy-phenyl)propionate/3-hydroxycinnamic acid hydroxylase [Acidimicrobiales bacterium]
MTFDVAIAGCGPVGGVLASLLGQQGHRVVVLERHLDRYPLPRAVHFDHETARILQACGLGDVLPELSQPAPDYEWRSASGQVLLRFGGRELGPSGWPDGNMFWQPALEEEIERAATRQPTVEIRRGAQVVGLDDGGDAVRLEVSSPATGGTESVEARYVVGCDGANSTVRGLIGSTVHDLGFFFDWLIVDVVLHEPRTFDPLNLQVCDPVRPTTAVSGGPGRRRWEFMRLPGETVEELDREERAWELLEPWDVHAGNATLERHTVYRFHARWVDQWRQGRVLLAGDAAHQMPPFAGQGMCSGLRDAANLAWKLDLVLQGAAPAALLDAYQHEREPNVRAVIELSMALGRVICVTDPDEAAARDTLMTEGAGAAEPLPPLPGIVAGIVKDDDPLAGSLFVQGRLADPTLGPRRLDDLHGAGWRLVATEPLDDALPADLASWFSGLGGSIVVVSREVDVDGTYARWFADHGCAAVLQRPDFHLFGSAATAGDVGPLLAALQTALTHPTAPIQPGDPT